MTVNIEYLLECAALDSITHKETIQLCDHIKSQAAEIERLREALRDLAEAGSEAWGNERPCVRVALAALSGEPNGG